MREEWAKFKEGRWCDEINVRDFIQSNYTEYTGDESFLSGPTTATKKLSKIVFDLNAKERAEYNKISKNPIKHHFCFP